MQKKAKTIFFSSKETYQASIKIIKKIIKAKAFIPSAILLAATIIIITLGYSMIDQSRVNQTMKGIAWKTKKGQYIPVEITSFTPSTLPTAGGNLTIKGKGFTDDLKFFIGSPTNIQQKSLALTIKKATDTTITALIPPHPAGQVELYLNYNGNIISQNNKLAFTGNSYQSETGVQIDSISPNAFSVTSLPTVTITGTGFDKLNTIKFGQGVINNIPSNGNTITFAIPSTLKTPLGDLVLSINKYDISVISNMKESNFETITVTR